MDEQTNSQNTNNQDMLSSQQADSNARVDADMMGTEHPTGQGINVGSGYISGHPSALPESIADAEAAGKEFIPTGTADPAAGVTIQPGQDQSQQQAGEAQNTNTSSNSEQ